MIYKIVADYENYCAFNLPMKTILLSIGKAVPPQKLMHFYRHNTQLSEHWLGIEASFTPVDGVTRNGAIPDITTWAPGTLVLSDKAKCSITDVSSLGELLPVSCPEGTFWVLNISQDVSPNESESQRVMEAGQVLAVEKMVFDTDNQSENTLFKTSYDGFRGVFCTQTFTDIVNESNISGVEFSESLTSAFP